MRVQSDTNRTPTSCSSWGFLSILFWMARPDHQAHYRYSWLFFRLFFLLNRKRGLVSETPNLSESLILCDFSLTRSISSTIPRMPFRVLPRHRTSSTMPYLQGFSGIEKSCTPVCTQNAFHCSHSPYSKYSRAKISNTFALVYDA